MNTSSISDGKKLIWNDEYSVNVKEIDEQHKRFFLIINNLIEVINSNPKEEQVSAIIKQIVEYKIAHFATEERYFHQFNYKDTAEHEAAHKFFNDALSSIQAKYQEDVIGFAFALVDFLEDWLIQHLMNMDQKYKQCFNDHGLS
jgi:hemerythrin